MLRHLSAPDKARFFELLKLQKLLSNAVPLETVEKGDGTNDLKLQEEKLKNELDDIIASDCIFCGEVMIQSVGESLVLDEEEIDKSWVI